MSKVLMLNCYNGNKLIDIEFDVDSCKKYVMDYVSGDWINECDYDELEDEDSELRMVGVLNEEKLGLIVVNYMMLDNVDDWVEVECYFVLK